MKKLTIITLVTLIVCMTYSCGKLSKASDDQIPDSVEMEEEAATDLADTPQDMQPSETASQSEDASDNEDMAFINECIAKLNKVCPTQIQQGVTMESVSVKGKNFVYEYEIDESLTSMDQVRQNIANLKQVAMSAMSADPITPYLRRMNLNVVFHYTGDTTGETAKCVLPAGDF